MLEVRAWIYLLEGHNSTHNRCEKREARRISKTTGARLATTTKKLLVVG